MSRLIKWLEYEKYGAVGQDDDRVAPVVGEKDVLPPPVTAPAPVSTFPTAVAPAARNMV
jgi:hypothetical protein